MKNGRTKGRLRSKVEEKLRPLTLPNFITLLRLGMVPFFLLAVNQGEYLAALALFVLAGLTDAMDGAIARWFDQCSRFGTYLDPIADKILLVSAYVALTVPQGQAVTIPVWLTLLALSRDALIVLVALVLYLVEDIRSFRPSRWGKATTFMHVLTVTVVLGANVITIPGWIPSTCFLISLALVLISGFTYAYQAARMIEENRTESE